jgi:hypothetical protein
MRIIASRARTKHLAAMLLIGAVALLSPSMALAHTGGGSSGGGGGHSGGGSSSSSSGHSTASSSSHRSSAVTQGGTHTTSSNNKKRWLFFRRGHVMHTVCESEPPRTTPASTKPAHAADCDGNKSSAKPGTP